MLLAFLSVLLLLVSSGRGAYNVSLDDGDPQITYLGNWSVVQQPTHPTAGDFFGGAVHLTITRGSSARLAFEGSAIYYYGDYDVDNGLTTITLDGEDTVSSFIGPYKRQVLLFQKTGMANTSHNIIFTHSDPGVESYTTVDHLIYTVEDPPPPPPPPPLSSSSSQSSSLRPPSPSSSPSPVSESSSTGVTNTKSLSAGSKAAIGLGSAAGALLLLGLLWVCYRRLRQQSHAPPAGTSFDYYPPVERDVPVAPLQYRDSSFTQFSGYPEFSSIAGTSQVSSPPYADAVSSSTPISKAHTSVTMEAIA